MKIFKKFNIISIFGIAMAFLEAAVVIYLREIAYPGGFSFPLKEIPSNLLFIEIGREAATIVMLLTVGMLAGKTLIEKFCYFIYSFGIWDIFYYVWLYILTAWPPSLFTDDLLFLIPVSWVGPVLAPVIVSITMIAVAVYGIYKSEKGEKIVISKSEMISAVSGVIIIFISFILDFKQVTSGNMPDRYKWWLFIVGEFLIIFGFVKNIKK